MFLVLLTGLALAASPKNHTLVISGVQFPKDETVKKGDTVTWQNDDLVPHTVTADDNSFHSPTIDAGKSWTFKPAKTTSYKCDFHPNMHSKITVKP